jgi:hypothetical protein
MLGYTFIFIQYPSVPSAEQCMAQVYLLNTASCLLFGSLFAKVFRVTQIFKKPKEQGLRVLKIHDSALFLGVGILWLIEMIYTVIWHATSPLLPVHLSSAQEQYWTCESDNALWGLLDILANGIFLLYGVLLSIQSRRIPTVFNEAKFVAATMYNTLILGIIAILLGYVARNNDELYMYKSLGVFLVFTVDIGLLIGSKFPSLYGEIVKGKVPQFQRDDSDSASTKASPATTTNTNTRVSNTSQRPNSKQDQQQSPPNSQLAEVVTIPVE